MENYYFHQFRMIEKGKLTCYIVPTSIILMNISLIIERYYFNPRNKNKHGRIIDNDRWIP